MTMPLENNREAPRRGFWLTLVVPLNVRGDFSTISPVRTLLRSSNSAPKQTVFFLEIIDESREVIGTLDNENGDVIDDIGLVFHAMAAAKHLDEGPRRNGSAFVGFEGKVLLQRPTAAALSPSQAQLRPRLYHPAGSLSSCSVNL